MQISRIPPILSKMGQKPTPRSWGGTVNAGAAIALSVGIGTVYALMLVGLGAAWVYMRRSEASEE